MSFSEAFSTNTCAAECNHGDEAKQCMDWEWEWEEAAASLDLLDVFPHSTVTFFLY